MDDTKGWDEESASHAPGLGFDVCVDAIDTRPLERLDMRAGTLVNVRAIATATPETHHTRAIVGNRSDRTY